jgi:hypothetical protein
LDFFFSQKTKKEIVKFIFFPNFLKEKWQQFATQTTHTHTHTHIYIKSVAKSGGSTQGGGPSCLPVSNRMKQRPERENGHFPRKIKERGKKKRKERKGKKKKKKKRLKQTADRADRAEK